MRFGLKDVNELPSMEEFEKLVAESFQAELMPAETAAARGPGASAESEVEESDDASRGPNSPTAEATSSESDEIEKSAAAQEQ
jgi:segregation and condensation protein B